MECGIETNQSLPLSLTFFPKKKRGALSLARDFATSDNANQFVRSGRFLSWYPVVVFQFGNWLVCVFSCVRGCACWAPSKNQVIRRAKLLVLVGYWCCVVGEGDTSPCGGKILDSRFSVLDSPFSTPICSSPRVLKIAIKPRTLVRTCDCVSVLFARVCVLVLQWNGKLWIKCKRK